LCPFVGVLLDLGETRLQVLVFFFQVCDSEFELEDVVFSFFELVPGSVVY